MSTNNTFPNNFFDPITGEIMNDPVVGSDGRTYQRSSILEWFNHSKTSPFTRQYMDETHLIPNIDLRSQIQEALDKAEPQSSTSVSSYTVQEVFTSNVELKTMKYNDEQYLHVSVKPPSYGSRRPAGLVAVVDVSGSMGEEASVSKGGVEIVGFSRLDLVKHSLNTIVNVMNENDVLGIVTFTTSSKVVMKPMKMNAFGKKLAQTLIDELKPEANTNLWSGLQLGL